MKKFTDKRVSSSQQTVDIVEYLQALAHNFLWLKHDACKNIFK